MLTVLILLFLMCSCFLLMLFGGKRLDFSMYSKKTNLKGVYSWEKMWSLSDVEV